MKLRKMLISMLALATLGVSGLSMASCNLWHTHLCIQTVSKEATCVEKGEVLYTCDCGEVFKGETDINPDNHTIVDKVCIACGKQFYSEGLEYTLSDDGSCYIMTGMGTCTDKVVAILAAYEGLPVKEIAAKAFYECNSLTKVIIPDGVTTIGARAFYRCGIKSVVIPDSVTTISGLAFFHCALTSVTIPDSVTCIENDVFYNCWDLTSVTIEGVTSISYRMFYCCYELKEIVMPNVTSIDNAAFYRCESLTSVVIPDCTMSIGMQAFNGCTSLTSVTIGKSVTSIGDSAFEYCTSLTKITYNGTIAEWKAIEKGEDWTKSVPATEVVCTDGTVPIDA